MTRLEILNYYRNCIYINIDPHNCLHTKHTKFNQFIQKAIHGVQGNTDKHNAYLYAAGKYCR